jgi:hypothetical protein
MGDLPWSTSVRIPNANVLWVAMCGCALSGEAEPHPSTSSSEAAPALSAQGSGSSIQTVTGNAPRASQPAIQSAMLASIARVKSGGGLRNNNDPELNELFRKTVLALVDRPTLETPGYRNETVTDDDCEDDDPGIACTGKPIFTQFVINVHDFVNWQKSLATVFYIVYFHAEYGIPVHLYITDMVLQKWVDAYGEGDIAALIAFDPELVSVSYHNRAPYPYDNGTYWVDWSGWFTGTSQNYQELAIALYEVLKINVETGYVDTGLPGGFAYLKDVAGYAPYVAAGANGSSTTQRAAASVYGYLGAQFTVEHVADNSVVDICTMNPAGNLHLRGESVAAKAYEIRDINYSGNGGAYVEAVLDSKTNWTGGADIDSASGNVWTAVNATTSKRLFLNIKWHDNNFYMDGTPWLRIYANHSSADSSGNGICDTAPDVDGNGSREDFNGDGSKDVDDVAIRVDDNNACALKPERWDVGRGIDIDTYESLCTDYRAECGQDCGDCAGLRAEKCEETCYYLKSSTEQDTQMDNYVALLEYVANQKRFRAINGQDLVNMVGSSSVCP